MKTRESKYELLRIIGMFLIVLSHYCLHSGFNLEITTNYNKFLIQFFTLGNIGVNIFIILSGYFYKTFNGSLGKMLKLESEIWFYTISGLIISTIFGFTVLCKTTIIQTIFPLITNQYWFMTTYILLMIVAPIINRYLIYLEFENLSWVLGILFIVLNIVPMIINKPIIESKLLEFIFLYLLGAFLSKSKNKKWNNKKIGLSLTILCFLWMIFQIIYKTNTMNKMDLFVYGRMDIVSIILVCGIIILLENIEIKNNKFINKISKTTLGIYLLHEYPNYIVPLWQDLFKGNNYGNSPYMLIHMIICTILVFAVGILINFIYQFLFSSIQNIITNRKNRIIAKQ